MANITLPETNTIGHVLIGVAFAFFVDNVAIGGAVTETLPADFVFLVAFVIFAGAVIFGYRLGKKNL